MDSTEPQGLTRRQLLLAATFTGASLAGTSIGLAETKVTPATRRPL
ncbi:MAG TPA: hypothetical protein VF020_01475 [Chthoniobacterales bacterium]